MNAIIKMRLLEFLDHKKISQGTFEKECGLSNGYVNSVKNSIGSDKLQKIIGKYPELSLDWLINDTGTMLKSENDKLPQLHTEQIEGSAPYYNNLYVSGGQIDTVQINEEVSGYIKLPGITVQQFFPIVGCSMEPEIFEGDIIGVNELDRWEILDPDKIYMIITKDERMVKRLRRDYEDRNKIWCISSNYKEFSIPASEILKVFRVVYVSRWKRY